MLRPFKAQSYLVLTLDEGSEEEASESSTAAAAAASSTDGVKRRKVPRPPG